VGLEQMGLHAKSLAKPKAAAEIAEMVAGLAEQKAWA
jgi:hypothetical protein